MDRKAKILDIGMNLNRIGNWAADGYGQRKKRIKTFLENTTVYIEELSKENFPKDFESTFKRFKEHYQDLEKEGLKGPKDPLDWAERMMTWGNILTHRSKLA